MTTEWATAKRGCMEGEERDEIALPDIRMRPREAQKIAELLSRCDQRARELYVFMMEKWERFGFVVGTTGQSIVLDVPCGAKRNRLAMLLPVGGSGTALIALFWQSLRTQPQFPAAALDAYEKAVLRVSTPHVTGSSAHIRVDRSFDRLRALKLLKALEELAQSIRPELAVAAPPGRPVTPENLRQTLGLCPRGTRETFKKLIAGWMLAGRTVQGKTVGRVYLRMKTRAHNSGEGSRLARNFNLLVLAAPRGRIAAHIEATWGLADCGGYAYLDCIPAVVDAYERVVVGLPGFVRKGTLSRIFVGESFSPEHTEALLRAVLSVKAAEEEAY